MHLKEETKRNIERVVGLPHKHIQCLTLDEEMTYIKTRTGKQLRWPANACRSCTGNPLLSLGRYRTMEEVDASFDNMFPIRARWLNFIAKLRRR